MAEASEAELAHARRFIEYWQARHAHPAKLSNIEAKRRSGETTDHFGFFETFSEQLVDSGWPAAKIDQMRDQLEAELRNQQHLIVTPYDSFLLISLLAQMMNEADAVLERRKIVLDDPVLFATLRSGQVNAQAVRAKGVRPSVVFLDDGLYGYANLISKCVAQSLPRKADKDGNHVFSTAPEDVRAAASRPEVVRRFFDVVTAYLMKGDPHRAEQYAPHHDWAFLSAQLTHGFELFVVGHEYGHVAMGHLAAPDALRGLPVPAEPDADAPTGSDDLPDKIILNWRKELEADQFGAMVVTDHFQKQGFDLALSYWGIDVFFYATEVLHRCAAAINGETYEVKLSDTHPPAALRRDALAHRLAEQFGEDHHVVRSVASLGEVVDLVFATLYACCEPVFHRMSRDGLRTPPQWRQTDAALTADGAA